MDLVIHSGVLQFIRSFHPDLEALKRDAFIVREVEPRLISPMFAQLFPESLPLIVFTIFVLGWCCPCDLPFPSSGSAYSFLPKEFQVKLG